MKKIKIPEHWSAEEALIVNAFLQQVLASIWGTHGYAMGKHIERIRYLDGNAPSQESFEWLDDGNDDS